MLARYIGMTNKKTAHLGSTWAIIAIIDAAQAIGIDAASARGNLAECCAIADALGQRSGIKASGRTIDPSKVQALLASNL